MVEMSGQPGTLYGVYKRANEGTAHVYWADHGVASVGLRPHTVFGPGRDQGLTSAPTTAMLAAACGRPYRDPVRRPKPVPVRARCRPRVRRGRPRRRRGRDRAQPGRDQRGHARGRGGDLRRGARVCRRHRVRRACCCRSPARSTPRRSRGWSARSTRRRSPSRRRAVARFRDLVGRGLINPEEVFRGQAG